MKRNPVGWFEIPVTDMERAIDFYERVFGFTFHRSKLDSLDMAWFPMGEGIPGSTGSLVKHKAYAPSQDGTLVYFTSPAGDVDYELAKVEDAGGKIIQKKKPIGEHGFVAVFLDTEGNRVAIHSRV